MALITSKFSKEEFIVTEGESADSFYLIKQGSVSVWKDKKLIRNMSEGDSFGE